MNGNREEKRTDAAKQADSRSRFFPKMSWSEGWERAEKDLEEAERFDRRGLWLGRVSLALALLCFALSMTFRAPGDFGALGFGIALPVAISSYWLLWWYIKLTRTLYHCFGAVAVAGTFAGTFAGAVAFVSAFAVAFAVQLIRAYGLQLRADRNEERDPSRFLSPLSESPGRREALRARCEMLIDGSKRHMTLGLAGRRGLGKTNLLRLLLKEYTSAADEEVNEEEEGRGIRGRKDLRKSDLVGESRIRNVGLFVHVPTDFGEMSFLTALLEQLAKKVNRRLSALLPAVRSYEVERELQEKRRKLRKLHWMYVGLVALVFVGTGWAFWQSDTPDPLLDSLRSQPTVVTGAAPEETPSKLYWAMADSLAGVLEPRIEQLEDSLGVAGELLNPDVEPGSWNQKGDFFDLLFREEFMIGPTWDSLQHVAGGPMALEPDSLRSLAALYRKRLDSVAAVETQYTAAYDSLQALRSAFGSSSVSWWPGTLFYLTLLAFPALFVWGWITTREGTQAFRYWEYDMVQDEIALYERTEELLDRLKYHMTYGEGQQASIEAPRWLRVVFGLSGQLSRQVTRAMRPYTTLSLVAEYRQYVQDVLFYLNHALEEDEVIEGGERVQIVIAIDELDKVLDTDRLHEMLKSLKAIFEIEGVYYLLSISEDALGTYRLRHMQTKNEVDSAFTHILSVPPMDARASLWFYERQFENSEQPSWPAALLPMAIVLGGGVPRDMHRLSRLLQVQATEEGAEGKDQDGASTHSRVHSAELLESLYEEDQRATADLMQQNTCLGASWRQSLIEEAMQPWPKSTEEVEERLENLKDLSFEEFERENACSGEAAKQAFHQIQLLLYGMVVKGYIYQRLSELPPVESLILCRSRG